MDKISKETVDGLVKRTGLKFETCFNLLANGWIYHEDGTGTRFLSPIYSVAKGVYENRNS